MGRLKTLEKKSDKTQIKKLISANITLVNEKEDLERRIEIQAKENIKLRRELKSANEKLREKLSKAEADRRDPKF